MNPRSETQNWRLGPAAALLLAYMLVLQGIVAGVSGARASGPFGSAICFSKSTGPLGDNPATPPAQGRHSDKCCVFHGASPGGPPTDSPFVGEPPRAQVHIEIKRAFDSARALSEAATPPLGSRAPPVLI